MHLNSELQGGERIERAEQVRVGTRALALEVLEAEALCPLCRVLALCALGGVRSARETEKAQVRVQLSVRGENLDRAVHA